MTDAHKAAVEAAVSVYGDYGHASPERMQAAITAYRAAMAAEGWVMVRDVRVSNKAETWWYGWNACRAAMLGEST